GLVTPAQEMALIYRRHMHEYGTTTEHFGHVAVAQRTHATRNPNAVMRTPMTLADHQQSRWIAEPLRLLDCCLETDGGCAGVGTLGRARRRRTAAAGLHPGRRASRGADPHSARRLF